MLLGMISHFFMCRERELRAFLLRITHFFDMSRERNTRFFDVLQEMDLRVSSGKILRVKSRYPESLRFLGLWRQQYSDG